MTNQNTTTHNHAIMISKDEMERMQQLVFTVSTLYHNMRFLLSDENLYKVVEKDLKKQAYLDKEACKMLNKEHKKFVKIMNEEIDVFEAESQQIDEKRPMQKIESINELYRSLAFQLKREHPEDYKRSIEQCKDIFSNNVIENVDNEMGKEDTLIQAREILDTPEDIN